MNYDFIEIGTCDFDTLIQSTSDQIGLTIEPLQIYLDQLPNNPNVIKVNSAVSISDGRCNIFWVHPDDISKYNLPWYIRGCNSINSPHPTTLKILQENNLEHLTKIENVEVLSWTSLVKRYNIQDVKYLKIDCEGHDFIIVNHILDNNCGVLPKKIEFEANDLTTEESRIQTLQKALQYGYNFNYFSEAGQVLLTLNSLENIFNVNI